MGQFGEQAHGQAAELMSNPFPAVNEEAMSAWVGLRNFQLGRSYFEDGAILEPRLQGNTLKAWCQGSMYQPYRVWVAYSAKGIEEAMLLPGGRWTSASTSERFWRPGWTNPMPSARWKTWTRAWGNLASRN